MAKHDTHTMDVVTVKQNPGPLQVLNFMSVSEDTVPSTDPSIKGLSTDSVQSVLRAVKGSLYLLRNHQVRGRRRRTLAPCFMVTGTLLCLRCGQWTSSWPALSVFGGLRLTMACLVKFRGRD